jgi:ATP-dependent helicase HrpB
VIPLPIDAHVPEIRDAVRAHRAVVLVATPGAGKTTRVPPALIDDGAVILLQPRRVAARAIARRIAAERGWTVGRDVGWQVRFERRFSRETRLLVATEGVLTSRLRDDPLISDFRTIVLDEFHERSIHADLALALTKQALDARHDLRVVVMSATLDAGRVADFLGGCPIVRVETRGYPLEIEYRPGVDVADAVRDIGAAVAGSILCFLPGASEIRRAESRLRAMPLVRDMPILPLYGALDADAQDAALVPHDGPRVILATNIAETTLTVPDVTCVIDSGLQKVARYDAARAIDSLSTERITQDSADQRAGRAGRVRAGRAFRLWDARDRLRPHREPEIRRVDLASTALDVIAWGADPRSFAWYEAPPPEALERAITLLANLGALTTAADRLELTDLGRVLERLPMHPRLGRMLVAGRGAPAVALACAQLSERHQAVPRHGATSCDLLSAVEPPEALPEHVRRVARELRSTLKSAIDPVDDAIPEAAFRRAVLAAYPDRVARRRAPQSDQFLLTSGTGARLGRESGVLSAEFAVAVEVTSGDSGEAVIRLATGIERDWLTPTSVEVRHALTSDGAVRAWRVERYGAITLAEHPAAPDPAAAAALVADAWLGRERPEAVRTLERRCAFAGVPFDLRTAVTRASHGAMRLDDVDVASTLARDERMRLDRDAPETLALPSGRHARLVYRDDGAVVAAVKLQELFGLADSPRLGRARVPVTFELLAPNGRPVQVTSDLRSFWTRGYPEVRKELRARYPRHPWPEDPWTATPTHRTMKRR